MAWWEKDLARVASELASLDKIVSEGWFTATRTYLDSGRLAVEGAIEAHGAEYPVRLIFPNHFPLAPAWVVPQDPEAHWSLHQYGKGGPLCLELRPDNWSPSACGADVVRSAYNLLRLENPLGEGARGEVPNDHQIAEFQRYAFGFQPVLVGEGCARRIIDGLAEELSAFRWVTGKSTFPSYLYDKEDKAGPMSPPEPDAWTGRQVLRVQVIDGRPPDPLPKTREEISEACKEIVPSDESTPSLVLFVDGTTIEPICILSNDLIVRRELLILPDDGGSRAGRLDELTEKAVAIVGLGSVGSKVAESLVRSGVRVILIDGDVMLPGNLERHSLDWRDVGFRKVEAMRRRLGNIRPQPPLLDIEVNLNWQHSPDRYALITSLIGLSHLVVDATGDVATTLLVASIAHAAGKPFLSTEVFEGGIGCLIARSLPGQDAPYAHGRASFLSFCEGQQATPPAPSGLPYGALAENGAVIFADDGSVTVAAGYTARIAVDLLTNELDVDSPAWLLIGLKKGWLFTGATHVIGLHTPWSNGSTSISDDQANEGVERARALVSSLLPEAADANSSDA